MVDSAELLLQLNDIDHDIFLLVCPLPQILIYSDRSVSL